MEQDAAENCKVPEVVAAADVIEHARAPPLGDLAGVDESAKEVDKNRLEYGRVMFPHREAAAGVPNLEDGQETAGRKTGVESNSDPGHVLSVEARVPGEDNTADTENSCRDHVDPPANGLAVEGRVFGGDDGSSDEKRDAGVVDTGEHGDQVDIGDAVHGMPDDAAGQALASRKKEDGGDGHVGLRALREVDAGRVEVEGNGQDDDETEGVRPNVDQLVGECESGPDASQLVLGKPIALLDMGIDPPGNRELLVAD